MKKVMTKYAVFGLGAIAALGLAVTTLLSTGDGTVNANQPADAQTAWAVRCKDGTNLNEIKNKRGVCEIFQRQDIGETGERLLEFAITYPEGQKDAFGILILPTGILLQEGVKLSVDDGDMYQLSVRYCIPNGCIVHFNLDEKLINLMAKGKAASVNIFSADGQNLAISVPLTGFAKMLKGVQS